MASLNQVNLIGNITADLELKQTTSGRSVCNFSIGVNRPFVKDKSEGAIDVDFINIVCWGKLADFVCMYFQKGEPIFVRGRIQNRSWTDSDGQKRYSTEINAEELSFIKSKPQSAPSDSAVNSSEQN